MTSQLNVALIRKLRVSLMCLAYSLHIINGYLNKKTLADVRSTGSGIKCRHCSFDSQATWVMDVLMAYCFDLLSMDLLYNQALANVWSPGAGIKYRHCNHSGDSQFVCLWISRQFVVVPFSPQ